jgi:hypothetical protein
VKAEGYQKAFEQMAALSVNRQRSTRENRGWTPVEEAGETRIGLQRKPLLA